VSSTAIAVQQRSRTSVYAHAFGGMILRDARVIVREIFPFLTRTIMNPFLFTFVFTYVFPKIGQGFNIAKNPNGPQISFATILVPGLVAVAMVFQGISAVALPLVNEFGRTREIEDRVMAPVPVAFVGLEKIVFGAMQAVLAALIVFPFVIIIPSTPVSIHVSNWPLLVGMILIASLVSGALGLVIGTTFKPQQIPLIFSIIVIPTTFLGCVYYPWARLAPVKWLQIFVLINPLVYMSEGLRTALTPGLPHMATWAFLLALIGALALLTYLGLRSFVRRVVA
jgi:ABC-2 type transport system permease protein